MTAAQFWGIAFWNVFATVLRDLPWLCCALTQSSYSFWKTEAFWKLSYSRKTLMGLHSCLFTTVVILHQGCPVSSQDRQWCKQRCICKQKKCPWGFQVREKERVFLAKLYYFEYAYLNLTSEYRQMDSFSITYVTAVKLPLDCFESMWNNWRIFIRCEKRVVMPW